MSHPNKAKGSRFEIQVRDYLRARGLTAHRLAAGGSNDEGDLRVGDHTLELKDEKRIDLSGALREAEKEAAKAGTDHFAAVIKRRGRNVKDSYVVVPLWAWTDQQIAIYGRRDD